MDTSALEPRKWGKMFSLLSMDIIIPMYEPMGLESLYKEQFKKLLRSIIRTNRKAYEENPQNIPPVADSFLKALRNTFSPKIAQDFYKWATTVFTVVPADQPGWSSWAIIFFYWRNEGQWQNAVKKKISGKKVDQITSSYIDYQEIDNTEEKIKEIKTRRLSDWDLEMFSIHKYFYNESELDENNDPFLTVENTIEINKFQLFWQDVLLPGLSAEEKRILRKEGEKLLSAIEAYSPGESSLIHPDQLGRQR